MSMIQKRGDLARHLIKYELKNLATEIRKFDKDGVFYRTREESLYRIRLRNRATVLAMASALHRTRLHTEKVMIDNKNVQFKDLSSQADFLGYIVTSPYSLLNSMQRKVVWDIIMAFDERRERAEKIYSDRLVRRRLELSKGNLVRFKQRMKLPLEEKTQQLTLEKDGE